MADINAADLLTLATTQRDQINGFMRRVSGIIRGRWAVPENAFDAEKFKLRYGLTDEQFSFVPLNGQLYVSLAEGVGPLPDDPPVFESPDTPQTPEQAATDLVAIIMAKGTDEERTAATAALLKFVGQVKQEV